METKMVKYILILTLLSAKTLAFAQSISREQVREDLISLIKGIQQYNPALYTYNSDFDRKSQMVAERMQTDSISKFEYFTLVSEICALSNEGHFSMGSWSDIIHHGIPNNTEKYLPIAIKVISNKIYLWEDYSNEQLLEKGTELVSINGVSAQNMLKVLRTVTPSDGAILTWTDRVIEIGFSWIHFFHIEQPAQYDIVTSNEQGEVMKASIIALTKEEQTLNYRKYLTTEKLQKVAPTNRFYELSHQDDYSLLKLPSFDYRRIEREKIKSKKFYQGIFDELSGLEVRNLVIDLRDNTGGRNEFADDIIPHVFKASTSDSFLKKPISWQGKEKVYKIPKPAKEVFKGDIYVLVNGRTYSAGSTLARYLKEYADAIIIGEETGTRYEGFSAGSSAYVTLPNTEVQIGIPRYHTFFPTSKKQVTNNRGLMPDHPLQYTFEDLLSKKDLHLKKVISLIDRNK